MTLTGWMDEVLKEQFSDTWGIFPGLCVGPRNNYHDLRPVPLDQSQRQNWDLIGQQWILKETLYAEK